MKPLNLIILTAIILLTSTTAAGAFYYQTRQDVPYIPTNLEYVPFSGGISLFDFVTNQTIPGIVSNDHIDVYTTSRYQSYTYKAGENVTIPLYLKFISDTKNSTTITINPQDPMTLRCEVSLGPGKGGIMINDYFHYAPEGVIKLKGLWPYSDQRVVPFNLLGVDSNVPMVPRFNWEIDV